MWPVKLIPFLSSRYFLILGVLLFQICFSSCRIVETYSTDSTSTTSDAGASPTPTTSVQAPSSLSYASNPATYTQLVAITNNTPSSSGGAPTSYSVNPSLPAGLSLNTSTGVISGTPTGTQSATNYTIAASNSTGSTQATLSITINASPDTPTVSSVSPSSGPLEGGTSITITGTNFQSGATVTFGSGSCTSVSIASATSITCRTPANSSGSFTVSVTNSNTLSGNKANAYTYAEAPTVISTSTLKLWLKADAITGLSDNQLVSSWTDSSENGNTMTQSTSINKPTYKTGIVNSKPVVRFAAASATQVLGPLNMNITPSAFTYMVVAKNADTHSMNNAGTLLSATGFGTTYGKNALAITTTTGNIVFGALAVAFATWEKVWTDFTGFHLITLIVPTTGTSQNAKIYFDGVFLDNIAIDSGGAWDTFTVGAESNRIGHFFNGDIAEILVYSSALSDADREANENYLNTKYKILPPRILATSRWSGSTSGGTTLTVRGAGFDPGSTVTLDTTNCTPTTYVSNSELTCVTPAHAAGLVNVKVTKTDAQTTTANSCYRYQSTVNTNPPDLTGLKLWLKPDSVSGLSDGNKMHYLFDSSSNKNDLYIPTVSNTKTDSRRPLFKTAILNSLPVVRFSTAQTLGPLNMNTTPTAFTYIIVAKNSDNHSMNNAGTLISTSGTGTAYGKNVLAITTTTGNTLFGTLGTATSWNGTWNTTAFHTAVIIVPTTGTSQAVKFYFDSINQGDLTTDSGGVWDKFTVGAESNLVGHFLNGDIAEVIIFTTALSDADRTAIQSYINAKFGL